MSLVCVMKKKKEIKRFRCAFEESKRKKMDALMTVESMHHTASTSGSSKCTPKK